MTVDSALAEARPAVYWLDNPDSPTTGDPLLGHADADLVVVGAGYTGLWAALLALEERPDRDVVVIEADRIGGQASGRNGGFCSASLTHGVANGVARFGDEIDALQELGRANLDAIEATLARYGIDADFVRAGNLTVATESHQLAELESMVELEARHGEIVALLDAGETRALVNSVRFLGGATRSGASEALVDPARLVWGLADAVRRLGGRIFESSPMTALERDGVAVVVRTVGGRIRARRVLLATNAFPSPLRTIRRHIIPVYDHVLTTEPLTDAQRRSVGWDTRVGLVDTPNLFHYSRVTADGRILWGGYDAVYHYGNRIDASLEQRDATHRLLIEHFRATFPELADVGFSHRWGGVIDTSTRFTPMWGTAMDGRVSYSVGYTGLGVGASRFGARVALDLLDDPASELLNLAMVRHRPVPVPPEPFRWLGVTATRRALARADRREGRRGPWLRLLDRIGVGFDS